MQGIIKIIKTAKMKTTNKGDQIVYDKYRKLVFCLNGCGEGESILQGVRAEKSMDEYGTDIY